MTTDNRTAMWLLPPIALQILHCLDDADDAFAFLAAAPKGSLDDALDALRTLLAMDSELPLWPTAHIARLDDAYNVVPGVVTRALPAFKTISVTCGQGPSSICHNTVLPPTTVVTAHIHDGVTTVRAALGKWHSNLVDLRVVGLKYLSFTTVIKDNVSACHGLRTLTMDQQKQLGQGTFDAALRAVVANCPQVERICVGSSSLSPMSDCKTLLTWLAQPIARHLEICGTDFPDERAAELATAMLTSNTLETIDLLEVPSLTRAVLSPSSPPLPQQLRHLTIGDATMEHDYDSYDEDNDAVDPPPAFDEADVAALAAKIAMTSCLESLELWLETRCDATPVISVLPQLSTLTKLALQEVHLTSFPILRQLWHLELCSVTFSDAAIELLATFLGSSPKLVQLDLGYDPLPDQHANIVFGALPLWLSRRRTACEMRLAITSDASASAFATALAQTRNSHKVKITVAAYGVPRTVQKQLVAALTATSRMALVFRGGYRAEEDAALEAYGREQRLQIVYRRELPRGYKLTWFHSPCASAR